MTALSWLLFLPPVARASSGLDGAERLTLQSKALAEERVLAVVTPASYASGQGRYPVLYLTDAEAQLGHARATAEFLAGNGLMPEVILVGILNTHRTRDLTPTRGTSAERTDYPTAGGGESFLDFLERELAPSIDARYRTFPLRLFAGHSFGGLLGIHALLSRPGLFQAVVAASPSLGWDDGLLLREARALKAGAGPVPKGLYVTLGEKEASPPVLEDFEGFAQGMRAVPWPGFDFGWQRLPEEDHGSSVLLGYYAGLRHLFSGWRMPLEAPASLATVQAHFQGLSARWGYAVEPPETLVNWFGYAALQRRAVGEALDLFRFNVGAHPLSANAQAGLGEGLVRAGQLDAARECYRQAVQLGEKTADPALPAFRAHLDALDERLRTPPASAGR